MIGIDAFPIYRKEMSPVGVAQTDAVHRIPGPSITATSEWRRESEWPPEVPASAEDRR